MKNFVLIGIAGFLSVVSVASAQQYRVWIRPPVGQLIDSGFVDLPPIIHGSYSGIDIFGNPQDFTADAMGAGGQIPLVDIQASSTNAGDPSVESTLSYVYQVNATAGSTRNAVPLIIRAACDVQAIPSGLSPGAYAYATVRVSLPLNNNNPVIHRTIVAAVDAFNNVPSDSFSQTLSTVVFVGHNGRVELRAYGAFSGHGGEVSATADPTFEIDPSATYEENGQTYFYTDEFMIEYSSTIEQYIPCPADITGDGQLDFLDLSQFTSELPDYNGDTAFDFLDISAFVEDYVGGCP